MTAGSIDDRLASEEAIAQYLSNPQFAEYYSRMDSLPILKGQTPFGAGISEDGQTRYVDPRLNTILNGQDISSALATHESVEWALREFCQIGVDYADDPRGHRLANRAEYNCVTEIMGEADEEEWEEYDQFLDPQIRKLENLPLTSVPNDLALYPYESDEDLLEKIKAKQGKLAKSEVSYTDTGGPDYCSGCINFTQPSTCALVAGQIDALGWCEEFDKEKL